MRASSICGSIQNFASPSADCTWTWSRASSREKKKNRTGIHRRAHADDDGKRGGARLIADALASGETAAPSTTGNGLLALWWVRPGWGERKVSVS